MLKKCLIGLAIYAVIAIGIMFGMIYYHNSNSDSSDWSLNSNLIVGKGSDPYGTYDQDDIVINDVDTTYKTYNFRISQISGLKDDKIENKINQEIKKAVFDMVDKYDTDSIYTNPYSSFGNTLSILVSCYTNDEKSAYKSLNYNLVTGEKLKLKDLFCDNANYAKIFYMGLYNESNRDDYWDALDDFYSEEREDYVYFDEEKFVAQADDDQIYRDVKKYLAKMDEINFAFSETHILIERLDGNGLMTIQLKDIKDMVNIFDKYKTAFSIYEESDIGTKGVPNFSFYHPEGKVEKFGFIGDNIFVDFSYNDGTIYDDEISKADPKYFELFDKTLNERKIFVDDTIKKAKNDKSNFYIIFNHLSSYISCDSTYDEETGNWDRTLYDICEFDVYSNVYVIPKDVYENEYKDLLYKGYQDGSLGYGGDKRLAYNYDDDGNLIPEKYGTLNNYSKTYNYVKEVELTDPSQIFVEGFDYNTVLLAAFMEDINNSGYDITLMEGIEAFGECNFSISSYGIDMKSDIYKDAYPYISFNEFDKSVLNFTNGGE